MPIEIYAAALVLAPLWGGFVGVCAAWKVWRALWLTREDGQQQ